MPTVNGFNTTQGVLKYNAEKLENYNTPEFSSSTTYSFGDYVIYQGKLYKYTSTTPSSGSWNGSNWTFIVLTDEIKTLFNNINTIEGEIPQASNIDPLMNGVTSAGVSNDFSRADHVHPKDNTKQDVLVFDSAPTQNSPNPVTSGGIYTALANKQNLLTFDNTPTKNSINPVKSNGIYESILNLYPINEASGSIASFSDGADNIPMKSVVCDINPIQDLRGYDAPWPAGGGKNKWSVEETFEKDSSSTYVYKEVSLPAGTYTISGLFTTTNPNNAVRFSFRTTTPVTVDLTANGGVRTNGSFTLSEDCTYVRVYGQANTTDKYAATFTNVQVEEGSTATDFAPYSNICPISGFTGLNVYRTGKNLLDPSAQTEDVSTRKRWYWTDGFLLEAHKSYTFTEFHDGAGDVTVYFMPMDSVDPLAYDSHTVTYTPTADVYVRFQAFRSDGIPTGTVYQLEVCSTASAYTPYQGTTYPVSWQSEAGAVYGGALDVVSGVLTVTHKYLLADGTNVACTGGYSSGANRLPAINVSANKAKADSHPVASYLVYNEDPEYHQNTICVFSSGNYIALRIYDIKGIGEGQAYADNEALYAAANAYLQSNNLEILYELATPVTYQLTPTEVETLVGENVCWHDANGDISVTYRADPTLFVDKKLSVIPDPPTANGTYNLQVAVSSGTSTYSWVTV